MNLCLHRLTYCSGLLDLHSCRSCQEEDSHLPQILRDASCPCPHQHGGDWEVENSIHTFLSGVYTAGWQHSKRLLPDNLAAEATLRPSLPQSLGGNLQRKPLLSRGETPRKHLTWRSYITKLLGISLHVTYYASKGWVTENADRPGPHFPIFQPSLWNNLIKTLKEILLSTGQYNFAWCLEHFCYGLSVKLHARPKACGFGLQIVWGSFLFQRYSN